MEAITWKKSSYSSGQGQECVEVAPEPKNGIAVRDSRNPQNGVLWLDRQHWCAWIRAVKDGDL